MAGVRNPDRFVQGDTSGAGGNVSVTNFPADFPDAVLIGKVPDESGVWSYYAGVAGVVNVTGRVIGIAAATTQSNATVVINGGDSIPIPIPTSGVGAVELAPRANLTDPVITFANTDSYLVEVVV